MSKAMKFFDILKGKLQIIVFWLLAVLIFILNVSIINKCSHPIVLNDELGYWTNAASLLGHDWSGVTFDMPWYSFGYSLIILPFMSFIDNTDVLYQTLLYVNVIMLVLTYIVYTKILKQLFPEIKWLYRYAAAATGVLYTSYQVQVNVTWSETALLLVTALITYFVMSVIKKPGYLNCIGLGSASVYAYMIHNRSLGLVASVIFVLFLLFLMRKIKLRYIAVFFAVFAVGYIANGCIKDYLEPLIWGSGERLNVNEMGGILRKLKVSFTTVDGFKRWLSLFMSQSFGVFVASACVTLAALWSMLRNLTVFTVGAVREKSSKSFVQRFYNEKALGEIFIICSFIASLVISTVFLCNFNRIDQIVYTRYADMTVGIIIAVGFCYLMSMDKTDLRFFLFVPVIMYLGCERADVLLNHVTFDAFNKLCSPGLALMYKRHDTDFSEYFMIGITMFCIIVLLSVVMKKRNIGILAAMICCVMFFVSNSAEGKKTIVQNQELNGSSEKQLIESIAELQEKEIYVLSSCGTFKGICQYYMPDKTIKAADNVDAVEGDAYVISKLVEYIDYSDYEIIEYSAEHILFRNISKTDPEAYTKLPLALMSSFDKEAYDGESDSIHDVNSNILCFGPYLKLSEGEYNFRLNFDIENIAAEEIGYVECKSTANNMVFSHVDLTDDMLDSNNNLDIDFDVDLENDIRDMEIVVYINSPDEIDISLDTIEYRKENAA